MPIKHGMNARRGVRVFSGIAVCITIVLGIFIAKSPSVLGASNTLVRLDWENQQLTSSSGFQHAESLPGQFSFDPSVKRSGSYSLKTVLKPGEDPLHLGGSTERAEVATLPYPARNSTSYYYSWSTRFASGWQTPNGWGIIWQAHSPLSYGGTTTNSYSPSVAIDVMKNFRLDMSSGNATSPANSSPPVRKFIDTGIPVTANEWFDFILYVKWSSHEDGVVTLSMRSESQPTFRDVVNVTNTPTLISYNGIDGDHYIKHGLYRAASTFTNTLWHDNFSVSTTRDAALATWGTTPQPAPQPAPAPTTAAPIAPTPVISQPANNTSAQPTNTDGLNTSESSTSAPSSQTTGDAERSAFTGNDGTARTNSVSPTSLLAAGGISTPNASSSDARNVKHNPQTRFRSTVLLTAGGATALVAVALVAYFVLLRRRARANP